MITEVASIFKLKKAWKSLINEENGKAYLTYTFNKLCYKYLKFFHFIHKKYYSPKFFCYSENGNIKVILPLAINYHNKDITFLGLICGAGYNDFVYNKNVSFDQINEIIEYVKTKYDEYTINLNQIIDTSYLNGGLFNVVDTRPCYKLLIDKGFSGWYENREKGLRQTIRGMYNRMSTDSIKYSFKIEDKSSLLTRIKCFKIYNKRIAEITHHSVESLSIKRKLKNKISNFFAFIHSPFFNKINKYSRSKLAVVRLNKKIVSFMCCYKETDGYIFPKMGFNTEFSRYNPGLLLIVEFIKTTEKSNDSFILDFSRGYHDYKVRYGCYEYQIKKLIIK